MTARRPSISPRIARQLDNAIYAQLNSRATSDCARALVDHVYSLVVEWETKRGERAYKRGEKTTAKVRDAIEAFTADLLRAQATRSAHGWTYRAMQAGSFSKQRVGHRQFARLTDALKGIAFIEHHKGFRALGTPFGALVVMRSKSARFRATTKLLAIAKRHGIEPANFEDHFLEDLPEHPLVLRAGSRWSYGQKHQGRLIKVDHRMPKAHAIESDVRELNEFLRDTKITGGSHRYYFRGFNNGDEPNFRWDKGGRLYSAGETSYQQLDRKKRLFVKLNEQPVVELDISASYLTIFLGWQGVQIEQGRRADPYARGPLRDQDRDAVKQWFVATFGSGKFVQRWSREAITDFRDVTGKALTEFNPARIQEAALEVYPALEAWPGSKSWADLMWVESEAIIAAMLTLKRKHGVPSLCVHDSLLVPMRASEVAQAVLTENYRRAAGVTPIIKVRTGLDF